jgi:transportin-1
MLQQAKASPDINNYLTFLFVSQQPPPVLSLSPEEYHVVRSASAIMLKNNVKTSYSVLSGATLAYIRSSILLGLQDGNPQIRNFTGNVITEMVRQGGILGWTELLPELIALVGNDSGSVSAGTQEGAMGALSKVCEDNSKSLDKDYGGQKPLFFIIPKLLDFTSSSIPKVRTYALASINVFIPQKSEALIASLDAILAKIFILAADPSDDVRRNVCRCFVNLVDVAPEKLVPHMEGIVDYTVSQQRKVEDPELALDAAELWLCVGEHDTLRTHLGPYLPKIVPVLLESMVYSEEDILMLEGAGDDAEEEDREEDIKPKFAKAKGGRGATNGEEGDSAGAAADSSVTLGGDDDELSDGEVEEWASEDEDADPEDRWNLRKCSAAALDVLASVFHSPVFEVLLPYLKDNIRHEDWPPREAAVLALGAIADGCLDAVTPNLPELVPYLISLLSDKEPLVRQITCWTLGRYSQWASQLEDPTQKKLYFEPMMEGILFKMLDGNKRVQEAGASAFANLEEIAKLRLVPYTEPIVRQFVRCFDQYKDRNMYILYDCVQTLAEHVGPALARPELVSLLMPALLTRWQRVSDQSRELFPLLECLSYVATALGDTFAAFATPIFDRSVRIIHQNLESYLAVGNSAAVETPDKDFLVTSLDLLSAVIQALEDRKSAQLVASSTPPFFELLAFCMKDPNSDVRQSAYALLGDSAIFVFPQLQPFLQNVMLVLTEQLDLDQVPDDQVENGFSVINNACWACGEIAIRHGAEMAPYVDKLFERLLTIIINEEVPDSVKENAAIALGRLGIGSGAAMAPHLAAFAEPFLTTIYRVEYTDEKDTAFQGFTMTVRQNPQAMENSLGIFFNAIARYKHASHTLKALFESVSTTVLIEFLSHVD